MRISDWSSDVCSSDLDLLALAGQLADADDDEQRGVFQTDDALVAERRDHAAEGDGADDVEQHLPHRQAEREAGLLQTLVHGEERAAHDLRYVGAGVEIGRASCRERVCPYV